MNDLPLDPLLQGLLPDSLVEVDGKVVVLAQRYRILGHMKFDGKNYTADPDHPDLVSTMSGQTHSAYLAYDKVRSECISILCGGAALPHLGKPQILSLYLDSVLTPQPPSPAACPESATATCPESSWVQGYRRRSLH